VVLSALRPAQFRGLFLMVNPPPSLYLGSEPAYFGALPWPPTGPEVASYVNDIPANKRFDAMPH